MKAPAFSLPDQNGKQVSLEQFKGKRVVLYFYPKADTPGCTTQACDMRDSKKTMDDMNTVVIGISPDEAKDLKHFEKKYNLNFPLLADPEHTVLNKYGVWKEKTFMGRRFMGVERTTVLIDEEGNIVQRYERVNPVTHASTVLGELRGGTQSTGDTNAKKTNTKNKKTNVASNSRKKKSKHNKKRAAANA